MSVVDAVILFHGAHYVYVIEHGYQMKHPILYIKEIGNYSLDSRALYLSHLNTFILFIFPEIIPPVLPPPKIIWTI